MEILYTSLYKVGHDSENAEKVETLTRNENVSKYINDLLTNVFDNNNKRSFKFRSDTVEISIILNDYPFVYINKVA